ncbi:hypothetical protein [Robiginitomaculum antarcticum]|nr:hypothetical protein [Robiginitomaculum antarcticum]
MAKSKTPETKELKKSLEKAEFETAKKAAQAALGTDPETPKS